MGTLDLAELERAGANSVGKAHGRKEFRLAYKEAVSFNQNFKAQGAYSAAEEKEQIRRLDKVLELAGKWLTSKPLKQESATVTDLKAGKNAARWAALAHICEQCSGELIAMGYRPLFGHWNSDPLQEPGAHANYWLERLDPKHRGASALKSRYQDWAKLSEGHKHYGKGFFEYVDADISAKGLPCVRYDKETEALRADERRKRRNQAMVKFVGGMLRRCDELGADIGPFDSASLKTEFAGPGFAIFVWDHKRRVFSGNHIANSLHHSTFRGGRAVRCAGEFRTDPSGSLVMLTSKTGHYTTTPKEFREFVRFLCDHGVVNNQTFCVPDTAGQTAGSWKIYAALEWVNTGGGTRTKDQLAAIIPKLATEQTHKNFWGRLG